MAKVDPKFAELMEQVRGGSEDATRQLVTRFARRLYRVIRRRLHRRMRNQFDSHDFFQAVWASFFANRDLLGQFNSPQELEAFLNTVAANKVVDECRRRLVLQKYNVEREEHAPFALNREDDAGLAARDPSPSAVLAAKDEAAQAVRDEPSLFHRVLELRLGGATSDEIAQETGLHPRAVQRVLRAIGRRITRPK